MQRVLQSALPHGYDLAPGDLKHDDIALLNVYIRELCCRCEGVEVVDTDSTRRCHNTTHGMHLQQSGEQLLERSIVGKRYGAHSNPPQPTNSAVNSSPESSGPGLAAATPSMRCGVDAGTSSQFFK